MSRRITRWVAGLTMLVLTGVACSSTSASQPVAQQTHGTSGDASSPAATLRANLDTMLAEHVMLAAAATNAALGGRTQEYEAAAGVLLGKNADDLAAAIGSVYGDGAKAAFLPLWKKHIAFFVDYTTSFGDKAKHDKAVADLVQYTKDFGAFLASANPNLTKDAVAKLVEEHVLSLKAVVDAQHAKDHAKAYTALVEAVHHMDMIGGALAEAIAKQFPEKF